MNSTLAGSLSTSQSSMQLRMNAFGQRVRDAGHARKIFDACRLHRFQSAEMREERLPALRADAADLLQRRRIARLGAPRAMALDREAMCLVANLLQQVQAGMIGWQVQYRFASGEDDVLEPGLALGALRDADQRRLMQSLLGEHFRCDID